MTAASAASAITIVEEKTQMGDTQMTLVIECPKDVNPECLTSLDTRKWVTNEARARGFPARGLGNVPVPYPVDADGQTDDDLIMGKRPFVAFRADYQINAGIG